MSKEWINAEESIVFNVRLSQPFGSILFLVVEATNSLSIIPSCIFPELSSCGNG